MIFIIVIIIIIIIIIIIRRRYNETQVLVHRDHGCPMPVKQPRKIWVKHHMVPLI